MKYKVSFLLIALILIFVLSGCSDGIKEGEAKEQINLFFDAIEQEDYEAAEELLHPDRQSSISELIIALEAGLGLDFQEGMEIDEYTGFSSALYDTSVKGSTYALDMIVSVGDVKLDISIQLVRNDKGFGIYTHTFVPR